MPCVCAQSLSRVWLSACPWTVALQALLSMGFSRQEYWHGFPCPPPRDLPHQGIEPVSLVSPALAGRFFTTRATWEAHKTSRRLIYQTDSLEKVLLSVPVTFQLPFSVAEAGQAHSTIEVCLLFVCRKLWAETRVSRFPARNPSQPRCHHDGHTGAHLGIQPATDSHQSRGGNQTDGLEVGPQCFALG